jgi:hypothetical protein
MIARRSGRFAAGSSARLRDVRGASAGPRRRSKRRMNRLRVDHFPSDRLDHFLSGARTAPTARSTPGRREASGRSRREQRRPICAGPDSPCCASSRSSVSSSCLTASAPTDASNDMPVLRRVPSVHLSGTRRPRMGNEPHAQVAGTIGNAHERGRRSGWSPGMELQQAVLATGGVPSFTEEVQPHAVH